MKKELPISGLMKDVTLHIRITGISLFKFRLWLGLQLIKLAGLIIGVNTKMEVKKDAER